MKIYLYIKDKAKMLLRFIDDLFMIGSKQELVDFTNDLNKNYPLIIFEFK